MAAITIQAVSKINLTSNTPATYTNTGLNTCEALNPPQWLSKVHNTNDGQRAECLGFSLTDSPPLTLPFLAKRQPISVVPYNYQTTDSSGKPINSCDNPRPYGGTPQPVCQILATYTIYPNDIPLLTSVELDAFLNFYDQNPQQPINSGGAPIDDINTNLLPLYCALSLATGTDCPTDPTTGTNYTTCPRYLSSNPDDQVCAQLYLDTTNQIPVDAAMTQYCSLSANVNAPECDCINRGLSTTPGYDIYSIAKTANPFNDSCWYKPCQFPQPSTLIPMGQNGNFRNQVGICPSSVCEEVIDNIDDDRSKINEGTIHQYISCSTDSGGGGSSFFEQYKYYFLAAGIIIFIIVIVLILMMLYSKHTKTDSDENSDNNGNAIENVSANGNGSGNGNGSE